MYGTLRGSLSVLFCYAVFSGGPVLFFQELNEMQFWSGVGWGEGAKGIHLNFIALFKASLLLSLISLSKTMLK